MRIDLHVHTNASDGLLEPPALVRAVKAADVKVFSITDHDTVVALEEAWREAEVGGLTLIPGIELSAYWGKVEFHILGYFIDPANTALQTFLKGTREARHLRLHAMLNRLQAMGIAIPVSEVIARARDGNVGRPHLARALVHRGVVASQDEAFDRYLGTDRPAYVPRPDVSVQEAIRVIRQAGGIASLAHPGIHNRDEAIPDLVAAGLTAIEVYHPMHGFGRAGRYRRLARSLNLLVTGGSDFHGEGEEDHVSVPGVPSLPEAEFDRLLAMAEGRAAPGTAPGVRR